MNQKYKCILSLGIRCFTEIFLKELELKKFSSPFDALYLSSINDIIYLLENKIEPKYLIHTQNEKKYKSYNSKWGYRTIHTKLDNTLTDFNNVNSSYHYATFAHHNLNDSKTVEHFERAFKRFDIIKKNKISTLFCLFIHPCHSGYVSIKQKDILKLSNYLKNKYNCYLLSIYFLKTNTQEPYSLLKKTDNCSIYKINNNSWNFIDIKYELTSIFENFNIKKEDLLLYKDICGYL